MGIQPRPYTDPTSVKFRPEIKAELQAVADNTPGESRGHLGAVIRRACIEYLIMYRARRISFADFRRVCPLQSVLPGITNSSPVIPIYSPENLSIEHENCAGQGRE